MLGFVPAETDNSTLNQLEIKQEQQSEMPQPVPQDLRTGDCGDLALICKHEDVQKVSMCCKCYSFFCEACFFDRYLTQSHGGD